MTKNFVNFRLNILISASHFCCQKNDKMSAKNVCENTQIQYIPTHWGPHAKVMLILGDKNCKKRRNIGDTNKCLQASAVDPDPGTFRLLKSTQLSPYISTKDYKCLYFVQMHTMVYLKTQMRDERLKKAKNCLN